MKVKYTYLLFFFAASLCIRCLPPTPEPVLTTIHLDLKDPLLKKIIHFQDYQLKDSLVNYFKHKDPTYRYAAAMAFGSFKAPQVLDSLAVLLKDPVEDVRIAAAHAIGQQGELRGEKFLIESFEQSDSLNQYDKSNGIILEAVGKCASKDMLNALGSISTYQPKDTFLLEGQAKGIYRFALRNITDPKSTSKMLEFVNNRHFPNKVRFIAANYLARAKNLQIEDNANALIQTFETEEDTRIRMALALALGKINRPNVLQALLQQVKKEQDYRVKCNVIRALKNYEYEPVKATIWELVEDPNSQVAQVASNFFISNGVPQEARLYREKARGDVEWPIQLAFYQAANKHLPPYMVNTIGALNAELRNRLATSTNPYERASAIRALGEYIWNYTYLQNLLPTLPTIIERTALVESLAKIANNPNFYKTFGNASTRISRQLGLQFIKAITSKDVGMMAVAAGALRGTNVDFRPILRDSLPIIKNAQQLLDLPKAIETYNELQKTIDFFEDKKDPDLKKVALNHPLDTALLSRVSNNPAAAIKTNKGTIQLQLLPLSAPGSVLNFIHLAETNFYDNKKFHRVVPNFVIQGGCPRGDGYGSLDYTIRSELPVVYYDKKGYVGMASAGNHTEGTQFFITHSPTPHLDGGYSIFATVTDGMDVVENIVVGDSIQQVSISYF